MFSPMLRVIAAITVFFFTWSLGGIYQVAYAATKMPGHEKHRSRSVADKGPSPEERLEKAVSRIEGVLVDKKRSRQEKQAELKKQRKEVDTLDEEIQDSFAETEAHLKKAGLSREILKRHEAFVKEYEDYQTVVRHDLDSLEDEPGFFTRVFRKYTTERNVESLRARFKERKERVGRHVKTFDPDNLPFQNRKLKPKAPRMSKEAFEKDLTRTNQTALPEKTKDVTFIDHVMDTLVPNAHAASPPPTPEDLAETIEVKFTPDIIAKAAELNHDPVKIYNFVRNTIEYVPTWGSIQGAQYCLETKQGNAFDTASLLIALLRASNIPARYVMGTIDVPIDQAMNWVGGFTDPQAALDFIASGGVPVKALLENPNGGINPGQIGAINNLSGAAPVTDPPKGQIKYARMEHVWVEAMVKYMPSRGSKHVQGKGDTWIKLDGSFKQYEYKKGVDIASAVPFDGQAFIDQAFASATINEIEGYVTGLNSTLISSSFENYKNQVSNYFDSQNPEASVGDLIGEIKIIIKKYSYLIGSLPYKTLVMNSSYSNIPEIYRHKLSFELKNEDFDTTPLSITKSLPELAGKKITLSYDPASPEDKAVIESYLPEPHPDGSPILPEELPSSLPAYLIKVIPVLKFDGLVVATGLPTGLGRTNFFTMTFSDPTFESNKIVNNIDAGVFQVIGLNLLSISPNQLASLKAKLESTTAKLQNKDFSGLTYDDLIGDLLYTTVLTYHADLDTIKHITSKTMGVNTITLPSETIFSTKLKIINTWGTPKLVKIEGLYMDADCLMQVAKSKDGKSDTVKHYMLSFGMTSSTLEHSVPELLFSPPDSPSAEGVSAVKALQIANDQGIPIYTINQFNITSILPQLQIDQQVKDDILNAINAGKVVTVSKTNINFNGWNGCGYIIINPDTGAGAYMISGAFNGSWTFGVIVTTAILLSCSSVFFFVLTFAFYLWYLHTINVYIEQHDSKKWSKEKTEYMIRQLSFLTIVSNLCGRFIPNENEVPKFIATYMLPLFKIALGRLPFGIDKIFYDVDYDQVK